MKGVRRDSADGSRAALLARIVKLLRRGESVALSGLPFVGKTVLAEKAIAKIAEDKDFIICRCPVTEDLVKKGRVGNFSELFFGEALKCLAKGSGCSWGDVPHLSRFERFIEALQDIGEYDGRRVIIFIDDFDALVANCRFEWNVGSLELIDEICAKLSYVIECGHRIVDDKTGLYSKRAFDVSVLLVSRLSPLMIECGQSYRSEDFSRLFRESAFVVKPMGVSEFNAFFRTAAKGRRISIAARDAIRRYSCGIPAVAESVIAAYDEKGRESEKARFRKAVEKAWLDCFACRDSIRSALDLGMFEPERSGGLNLAVVRECGLSTAPAKYRGTFLDPFPKGAKD